MRQLLPATLSILLAACASTSSKPASTPSAPSRAVTARATDSTLHRTALPPIPLVLGALAPRVVYPPAGATIAARDSNFIFGSVGNGRAMLTINGTPVPVQPNGSFLAFLPLPPASAPRYDLIAALGADTARLSHPVVLAAPRPVLAPAGPLVVDSASVTPRGTLALRDDELVRVAVRAPANAVAWVQGDPLLGRRMLLGEGTSWATDVPARLLRAASELVVARGADTVRLPLASVASVTPDAPTYAALGTASAVGDTDRVINARPTPGGTYKWFLLPGTIVEVTGRSQEFARVRLDAALEAWVSASDLRQLPAGTPSPRRIAGNARLVPGAGWVDFVVPVGARPAYNVEEGPRTISLVLYGTRSDTDILDYLGDDSLVRAVRWQQETSDRVRYTLELTSAPFGYLAMYQRGAFILRVRRAPRVNAQSPMRGLTIAIDPGHPPIGSTGPTGLYEPVPTLAVALRVRTLLEERGATVVMTRATAAPVALGDRPTMARRAGAHALVSIHLNALPDGINPFINNGTNTYFFHPQAAPLARALQAGMVAAMGLRDMGVHYDNLALARATWMPAVLCEGAFIIMPDQEAALRTPEFQDAYARGVVQGLERYFQSLASSQ